MTGEAVFVTNRFNTCSRISPLTGSCIYGRNTPPGVRILPIISYQLCGNAIKYNNHLKALQEHLSSQFTCLLSWSPGHSTRTFCSFTKWSRFGSKSIHEGEAKLYQTLSHMIPTKHAAQRKCSKSRECKNWWWMQDKHHKWCPLWVAGMLLEIITQTFSLFCAIK